jgi:hypothetical protein
VVERCLVVELKAVEPFFFARVLLAASGRTGSE